jgi:hypothetical protein
LSEPAIAVGTYAPSSHCHSASLFSQAAPDTATPALLQTTWTA